MKEISTLLFYLGLIGFLVWGWLLNVVKLISILDGDVTAVFVARVAGVFFFPLGVILGWLV
jgi:hypothetical protein